MSETSLIDKIKEQIGGPFSTNILTEEDLTTAFLVILGYYDMTLPDGSDAEGGESARNKALKGKENLMEQAQAQAKLIVHFVQNTAAPKEEAGSGSGSGAGGEA
tara:strand:- start:770 stop:1081 length:312 start_codon:yes stop_codon:yes gene_type:complete